MSHTEALNHTSCVSPSVTFVGAGPGAEDLITVRGLRLLQDADVVLYAGSLVNPRLLRHCAPHCLCRDSAAMNLEEQVALMSESALAGKAVVRLHTGDPAMYGAINEQIRLLEEKGVAIRVVPGVSSVFAAAATLGCELTSPEVSQSVVLTRTPGRTPMPAGEDAAAFARTGATLVFFLSTGNISELMQRLNTEGGLAPDTPAAVVYRASWPEERIFRGTIATIADQIEEAGFGRQALIFVGRALERRPTESKLYAASFSHGYRNALPNESFTGTCALYAFSDKGFARATEIATGLQLPCTIYSTRTNTVENAPKHITYVTVARSGMAEAVRKTWNDVDAHIFVGATGIAVRHIAPMLRNKASDPAVLSCPESGSHIISLAAGHLGGANRLARRVARITGGQAVIGTATDINGLPAFDEIAAQEHARICNPEALRLCNAALLDGSEIFFYGTQAIYETHFAKTANIIYKGDALPTIEADNKTPHIIWGIAESEPLASRTVLVVDARSYVLGMGCRRGLDPNALRNTVEAFLASHGLRPEHLARLASCDLKADEPAMLTLAESFGLPIDFHSCQELNAIPVTVPSEKVREKTGTASVSEASALLSAGYPAVRRPRVAKTVFDGITLSLARIPHGSHAQNNEQASTDVIASPFRDMPQGGIVVVGLGSGAPGQITPEVDAALLHCDTVAGYTPYVDFIRDRIPGKPLIQNGMMGELARCRATLEAAAQGQRVCMVCSGDPGILAMAGLLFELRIREEAFKEVPLLVLPGITSANVAAASLGAPLQNGFCLVSLSDLLVPTEEVRANLLAVAQAALPVALYNPAGKKRRHLLTEALEIFQQARGKDVLCAIVRHAGRPQESKWIGTLQELPADAVDMSSLVIIGGPRTKEVDGIMFEARGYVDKYLKNENGRGKA